MDSERGLRQRSCLACVIAAMLSAAAWAAEPVLLDSGIRPGAVEQRRYLDYARECIDTLIAHGTDRYGAERSPMLVSILDVRTRECPAEPLPLDEAVRVVRRGRRNPAGGNLYADQATFRAMLELSRITGDGKYRAFAAKSIGHYLKHRVDDRGLLWWGWHRHIDAHRDVQTGHAGSHHEIHVQEIAWPILWDIDCATVTREIEAVWQWHICDKATGECNRHADGRHGCDFAMSGGEMLEAFAFLYSKTHDRLWLDRSRLLADYYWKARHPETKLIPNRPNAGAGRFDGGHFDTSITAFHCRALLRAWQLTGDAAFRNYAAAYLKAYAKYGYDPQAKHFWGSLKLDGTPDPGPRVVGGYAQYEPRGHIDLWQPYVAGYEHAIGTAQVYAWAAQLTGDRGITEAAGRWAALVARNLPPKGCNPKTWYGWYATDWAPHGTYAGHYGRAISFFLRMHAITKDKAHLATARAVAREAVSKLYYRGLLRGHPAKPYYEAIDGVGYLLIALIQLDEAVQGGGSPSRSNNF